ncbi:MAG: ATP-dependent 6-phosphofructokinase [Myxococcales bacterium]|nr:ATP-dependent 6-phosphofructokinase [Myxococcales bacterium]
MSSKRRIGILTGGGDCPGLNAVIRAAVKYGVTQLGWEIIGIHDSFNGLLTTPFETTAMTRDAVRGILTRGGTILGTTNRGDPFAFPMKQADGTTTVVDRSQELREALSTLAIEGLICIGGDGTMRIAHQLSQLGIKVVGVPKTIDNDIGSTEVTFGFNTAVQVATDAIDRLHSTAESHDRVMVAEVMGRDCGWIALHAGIASGADVILIPELPYNIEHVCEKILRRQAAGRFFSIVVVAEGAVPVGGEASHLGVNTPGGMPRFGGAGHHVAAIIEEQTHLETRVTVLGHLLRGGTPSTFDRLLATRFGCAAARLIQQEGWGRMVAIQADTIIDVPLDEAIRHTKNVHPNGEIVQTGRALGIEFGA